MNGELQLIGIIIQSGAVGISGGLIWLLNRVIKGFNDTIQNHMHESSVAMKAVAKSNLQVAKSLQKLNDVADSAIKGSRERDNLILKKLKKRRNE